MSRITWRERPGHRRLRIAACHQHDDIGTVDSRSEIARHEIDCSKPALFALDIDPTAHANASNRQYREAAA
jgi:hypothetical protein